MTKTASRHFGGRFDHILLVRLPILEGASGEDYTVETDGTSADGNGFPIFLIHFLQCIIQRQSAFPEITVQQSQRLPVFLLQEVIDVLPLVGNQLPDCGIRVFRRAALRQPLARIDESNVPSVFSFKIGEPQKEAPVAAVLPMAQSQLVEDARAVGGGKNSFVSILFRLKRPCRQDTENRGQDKKSAWYPDIYPSTMTDPVRAALS